MKRKTLQEKRQEVNDFCKSHHCEACQLIMTEYCQKGSEEPKAIEEAYEVINNIFLHKDLNLPKEQN